MNKHTTLIAIICTVVIHGFAAAPKGKVKKEEKKEETKVEQKVGQESSLLIEDSKKGSGAEAVSGKEVTVHYTGKLPNGQKFDSSLDRKEPFKFVLGAGQVISGWDKGVAGMKIGGKRKLTIPPIMAYGTDGVPGVIPPNSTLIFEIELLNVGG